MIVNPFITTGKIPPELFCDRREESKRIVRTMTNGGNICLMAPRRIGKSKLIRFCFDTALCEDYYTIYVDIFHTTSLNEFTYVLGHEVFDTLKSKNGSMTEMLVRGLKSINAKFGFDSLTSLPTFALELGDISRPEYTLKEIMECLEKADKPCIVAIDEFQQVGNYHEKNIEAMLRSYIQHLSNVHFIFSGSERHMLSEMFMSSARPFYNSTDILELHAIAKPIYREFVVEQFTRFDKGIQGEDIDRVYELMNGNTYYMQKVFREVFSDVERGEVATYQQMTDTILLMIEDCGENFKRTLSRIPEKAKQLLYAIANEGIANKILSGQFIKKHSLPSASSVQAACKKLTEYDLIAEEDGNYRIADPLMALWISRFGR